MQEQICYKATKKGIPVKKVDPAGTSLTCPDPRCGFTSKANRDGTTFTCRNCGYGDKGGEHIDKVAAINIARR